MPTKVVLVAATASGIWVPTVLMRRSRSNVAEVVHGEQAADAARFVSGPQARQHRSGFGGGQFAAHPAGGELGQEAMESTDRLGAQRDELFAAV